MASREHDELLATLMAGAMRPAKLPSIEQLRSVQAEHVPAPPVVAPEGTTVEVVDMDGVTGYLIEPLDDVGEGVLVYYHGGGYICWGHYQAGSTAFGTLETMGFMARAARTRVLGVEYRLAPEFPFPAPVEDAVTSYRWLLRSGVASSSIVLTGDSAGGGLVVAAMVALRDAGIELPAAGVPISPWTDLAVTGASVETVGDPVANGPALRDMASTYLAGASPYDPAASPLYADLHGLPPLSIQVGTRESLLDDARRLADRARAAGVAVELFEHPGAVHMWTVWGPTLPESKMVYELIGRVIAERGR